MLVTNHRDMKICEKIPEKKTTSRVATKNTDLQMSRINRAFLRSVEMTLLTIRSAGRYTEISIEYIFRNDNINVQGPTHTRIYGVRVDRADDTI